VRAGLHLMHLEGGLVVQPCDKGGEGGAAQKDGLGAGSGPGTGCKVLHDGSVCGLEGVLGPAAVQGKAPQVASGRLAILGGQAGAQLCCWRLGSGISTHRYAAHATWHVAGQAVEALGAINAALYALGGRQGGAALQDRTGQGAQGSGKPCLVRGRNEGVACLA